MSRRTRTKAQQHLYDMRNRTGGWVLLAILLPALAVASGRASVSAVMFLAAAPLVVAMVYGMRAHFASLRVQAQASRSRDVEMSDGERRRRGIPEGAKITWSPPVAAPKKKKVTR